jgi:hypothetical protein
VKLFPFGQSSKGPPSKLHSTDSVADSTYCIASRPGDVKAPWNWKSHPPPARTWLLSRATVERHHSGENAALNTDIPWIY